MPSANRSSAQVKATHSCEMVTNIKLSFRNRAATPMASRESKKVVDAAIIANLAIAAAKYTAAALTGSSAMLAEALHSTADTGNELLLLVGMKRSTRPPDELHAYGHGKAPYFYSLLVAVYIFGVGYCTEMHTCRCGFRNIAGERAPAFSDAQIGTANEVKRLAPMEPSLR